MKPFTVYLLHCADGSYYCGHTDDLDKRMQQHDGGQIGYTSERKPVELVWQGEFETREGALAFELQVKGWSRAKKEALIAGDWERIKTLAKSTAVRAELVEAAKGPSTGSGRTVVESGPSTSSGRTDLAGLAAWDAGVLGPPGAVQRRAIAKAITLLESTRADHRARADEMLTALLPHTGKSFRLGISGVPGVGKSTFIEALGLYLIDQGHRVAVLTIDPSSSLSGGSILGDKTRMEKLSVHERAFIRPSPSSGTLGGVAEKTREAMLVCEAAGYDIVIVETVGVGQSEIAVAGMTDMFALMQLPNAGDDLQAIKKGVMELADLVVINKADLDADAATRARAQITSALRIFTQHGRSPHPSPLPGGEGEKAWSPQVIQLSALLGEGVDRFWSEVERFKSLRTASGELAARRQHQALAWMWERIDAGLKDAFRHDSGVAGLLPALTKQVAQGELPASTAARKLLDIFGEKHNARHPRST
jgi:LAO/AO transport system kinase